MEEGGRRREGWRMDGGMNGRNEGGRNRVVSCAYCEHREQTQTEARLGGGRRGGTWKDGRPLLSLSPSLPPTLQEHARGREEEGRRAAPSEP